MRHRRLVCAAILLLPATFVVAASCAGESDTDLEDFFDDIPPAKALAVGDGGCGDGGTDGGADGGAPILWPMCGLSDLWAACGIAPQTGFDMSYGSLPDDQCGLTTAVANSSTYCRPKVVFDPYKPACANACPIFRHEICHVTQVKALCNGCRTAHPGGGPAFNECVEDSGLKCRMAAEAQCHDEECNRGDPGQCIQQGASCYVLNLHPPSGSGLPCEQFTAGMSSCTCANMGVGQCAYGACSSGKSCVAWGGACTCVTPPPPQDAGADAPADAPEGG